MRLPFPNTVGKTPSSIGEAADPLGGLVSDFNGGNENPTNTTRPRRDPDYRLRGLDLGGRETDEASPRKVTQRRQRRGRRRRLLVRWVAVLTVAVLAALVLRVSVIQPFSVPSAAMIPTLQTGDRILVVKSRLLAGPIRTGDIVVFRHPKFFPCTTAREQSPDLVQRVIAVPGNTIWSAGNKIFIDGKRLSEPGWYDRKYGQVGSARILRTKIPPGKYYVMGDNRSDSCDSRAFGSISKSSIVGKVIAIVARDRHVYIHFF